MEAKQVVSSPSPLLSYSSNSLLSNDDSRPLIFPVVGNPFAIITSMTMILLIIRMKVLSMKRMELSQTITSLPGSIRLEKGMPAQ